MARKLVEVTGLLHQSSAAGREMWAYTQRAIAAGARFILPDELIWEDPEKLEAFQAEEAEGEPGELEKVMTTPPAFPVRPFDSDRYRKGGEDDEPEGDCSAYSDLDKPIPPLTAAESARLEEALARPVELSPAAKAAAQRYGEALRSGEIRSEGFLPESSVDSRTGLQPRVYAGDVIRFLREQQTERLALERQVRQLADRSTQLQRELDAANAHIGRLMDECYAVKRRQLDRERE